MSEEIVHASGPVALIGGGALGPDDLSSALTLCEKLVAADGGAAAALAAGHVPDAVVGDFDSLDAPTRARIPADRLHHVAEQDSTDFDKALRAIRAPVVLAVGFLGARLDHQLAAFSTLLRHADRPCVLVGEHELAFLAPPKLDLDLEAGDVVSLMPLVRASGRSRGLKWPVDELTLEPGRRIGTSNVATGPLQLKVDAPGLLVIVPRPALAGVTQALASLAPPRPPGPEPGPPRDGRSRWPVRA